MIRLRHSFAAYLRSLQVSRTPLFVFVEGSIDSCFYDAACKSACGSTGILHNVAIADELPGGTGGKDPLILFFDYLRQRNALSDNFKGKRTEVLFFLDKDIDDLLRLRGQAPAWV